MSYEEYDEYEAKCKEIRTKNEKYLDEFREDLEKAGLKEKTIEKHCQNVDFYINSFLLREEPLEMVHGTESWYLNEFLGYYFIRKCLWSTPAEIKSNIASFKKFYKIMLQRGYIDESNYRELLETIKINKDEWLSDCEAYNDPDVPDPFDMLFDLLK